MQTLAPGRTVKVRCLHTWRLGRDSRGVDRGDTKVGMIVDLPPGEALQALTLKWAERVEEEAAAPSGGVPEEMVQPGDPVIEHGDPEVQHRDAQPRKKEKRNE